MKLSTVLIVALILAGCATSIGYYKTNTRASTQPQKIEHQVSIQLEQNKQTTETLRLPERHAIIEKPVLGEPVGAGMPAPMPIPENKVIKIEKTETVSSKLFSAALAFAVTDKANIEDNIKAQLLIDPNKTIDQVDQQLIIKGTKIKENIKVSKIVKAKLTAPNFKVDMLTDEEQILSDDKSTEWLWKLTPTEAGVFEVDVSVTAIINIDGRESKHHLKTFDKKITVEVTEGQILSGWLEENWKWIISTLIIPILVFLFKEKFNKLISKDNR